jgi:hypothetical protein
MITTTEHINIIFFMIGMWICGYIIGRCKAK